MNKFDNILLFTLFITIMAQCKKTNFSSYQISSIKNVPVKNSKFTMTFSSESYAENIVTKDNQFITTKHTFKKTYKKEGQVSELQQLQRPYYINETTQGGKKDLVTKKVTTNSMNFIDILIVLDNSGSLKNEHNKIKYKLPALVKHIKDKEWQIRLVTTDIDDNCDQFPIISNSMSDAPQLFKNYIENAGTSGSGSERGIYKTAVGLGLLLRKCQWVRDQSSIAVLIVSDEVNFSDSNKPARYLELEKKIKDHPKFGIEKFNSLKAFGILLPDENNGSFPDHPRRECKGDGGPDDLLRQEYYQFINDTQGQSYSLCPDDYSEIFDDLSKSFAQQLATISLDSQPALDTLVVKINGFKKVINKDYKVKGKKIEFLVPTPNGTNIDISYYKVSKPVLLEFSLASDDPSIKPWEYFLEKVEITSGNNNININNYPYKLSSSSKIIFTKAPPDFSEIKFLMRKKQPPLQSEFTLEGSNIVPESINVFAKKDDGNEIKYKFEFDDKSNIIKLKAPLPQDSDIFYIKHETKVELPIDTIVPIDNLSSEIEDLAVKSGDQMLEFVHINKNIDVKSKVTDGQEILITYRKISTEENNLTTSFELPHIPVNDSLKLKLFDSFDSLIDCPEDKIVVDKKVVTWTCPVDTIGKLEVSYQYLKNYEQVFTVSLNDDPEIYQWTVKVNNTETTDFERQGNQIKIKNLPAESLVDITYEPLGKEKN